MADLAEDFCSNFYQLKGTTIAERRKNFFKLLHNNASLKTNTQVLDTICQTLDPQTYLETLFKVDFLIYFRCQAELTQLLKEGNDVFVSKICKQVWFFKDSFSHLNSTQIVNEILPCLSFSVRMKVLRKLSRYLSNEKFDEVFDAVVSRYGIFIASKFITGCTSGKILEILTEKPYRLTSTQLRILYEKDPDLIEFYFTKNSARFPGSTEFFKLLFLKDRDFYYKLEKKLNIGVKLGRRATKKYAEERKNDIIEKPHDFGFIDMKAVIRKFGKDSVKLLCNSLHEKPGTIPFLHFFPKRYHYSLSFKIFQEHYNIKYIDNPILIDSRLLDLIPDNAERAILAKVKVDEGNDYFIKYLETQDSIPRIKEQINLTSDICERGQLIKSLIQTCYINKDVNALFTVLKYFCFRHKNDEFYVHLEFIDNIERLFGFKEFTEEMWNSLNELLTVHMLKYNQDPSIKRKIQTLPLVSLNLGTSSYQKLSYLEFLFKKGDSIDELILEYFSTEGSFPNWSRYDHGFSKYFFNFIINNLSKDDLENSDNVHFNCRLIKEIINWNMTYRDDQLSFYDFPKLAKTFDFVIRNPNDYHYPSIIKVFKNKIFTLDNNQYRNEYLKIYWNNFDSYKNLDAIDWFLRYDPCQISENFSKIFEFLASTDRNSKYRFKIWYKIKKYSHLQINDNAINLSLSKINDETCLENKPDFVPCLSILMKPTDYALFANKFKPANKKLDLKNETEVRLYNLQCAIAGHFRNTKSYLVFDSLFNFCAGDYFKYAMRCLYCIMYRTPENMLPKYLNFLAKKAVSVRKHVPYFTCELCSCSNVESLIKLLNETEKDLSLQKHMFSTTIQYFVKNPSDSVFNLVKLNMKFINKVDEESLRAIISHISSIPDKYQPQYVQYSWEYLEQTVDIWKKLKPLKESLLSSMKLETIGQLPLEFGLKVIENHFMTEKHHLDNIYTFAFRFLTVKADKDKIFEQIFKNVNKCPKQEKIMTEFVTFWSSSIKTSKKFNLKYLEPFLQFYENRITPLENFKDFLKIFFLRLKLEASENDSVDFLTAKMIDFFQNVIISNYGPFVISLFASEMNYTLWHFETQGQSKLDFYHSMITKCPTPEMAILILDVITVPGEQNSPEFETFRKIITQIKTVEDLGVQINLRYKFQYYVNKF